MSKNKRKSKAQLAMEAADLELDGEKTLKEVITEYCDGHHLQDAMNEVINKCVKERPEDPFGYMAELLKEKSVAATGIMSIAAREVLDALGRPTVEAEVVTDVGTYTATVPSSLGKSRGLFEAKEVRDPPGPEEEPAAAAGGDGGEDGGDGGEDGAAAPTGNGSSGRFRQRFGGLGVAEAVRQVNDIIAPLLVGKDPAMQDTIDQSMIELDGTDNKEKLGANAILAVSMAVCRAGAAQKEIPLYRCVRARWMR